ncbi:MAG: hypothetical protein HY861_03400 [Chlamydiia bacterium]|nr:hypothetical protein [Chlamydiia bacterium]
MISMRFCIVSILIACAVRGWSQEGDVSSSPEEFNILEPAIEASLPYSEPARSSQEAESVAEEAVVSEPRMGDGSPILQKADEMSSTEKINRKPLLEIKGGYFSFSNAKLRKIYNRGGLDLQLSGSYPLSAWLHAYGSVEYLQRHGKSLNMSQTTSIWELPVSVGLKPVIAICSTMQYYFAIGPRYFYVHAHNRSSYVDKMINQNGIGGFVNGGFTVSPVAHLVIDIFGEYSYGMVHVRPAQTNVYGRKIQVGGLTVGLGIAYAL